MKKIDVKKYIVMADGPIAKIDAYLLPSDSRYWAEQLYLYNGRYYLLTYGNGHSRYAKNGEFAKSLFELSKEEASLWMAIYNLACKL